MSGSNDQVPHIVIVGGGFGGLRAARRLKKSKVRVTIIDRCNHHLFQPLLYQVATAGLSPAEIAIPIRAIMRRQKNVTVLLAEVTGVDLNRKVVQIEHTELGYTDIPYDYLVLAAGVRTTYYGNDGWEHYAVGLKSVDDALEIRRRVLLAFEAAERERDQDRRKRLMTFVVIGGGPTGVELAGALAELARFVLARDFREINPLSTRVILLEGGDRILVGFDDGLAEKARRLLEKLGVQVCMNSRVTNINADGVTMGDDFISAATVVWGAGVQGTPLAKTLDTVQDRAGRLIVEPDCSLPEHPNVFAIGDMAVFTHDPATDGKSLPGVAQVAIQQGTFVANIIVGALADKRPKLQFSYKDKGSLATIGRKAAIADIGRFKLTGFAAWLTWLAVHIAFLMGFKNKIVVFLTWVWSYITYKRGARLITGGRRAPGAPPRPEAATAQQASESHPHGQP